MLSLEPQVWNGTKCEKYTEKKMVAAIFKLRLAERQISLNLVQSAYSLFNLSGLPKLSMMTSRS